jgi:Ca2+-binding RTX toxin-like protein
LLRRPLVLGLAVALATTTMSPAGSRAGSHHRSCFGRKPTIVGTPKDDTIRGTLGKDVIAGLGGDDLIVAYDGDDLVCGGPGSDLLDAGYDDDRLSGGPGKLDIIGFQLAGRNVRASLATGKSSGGAGHDSFTGFEGIYGSPYTDHLDGDARPNFLIGEGAWDVIHAGAGNDLLWGQYGDDKLDGGSGRGDVASYYEGVFGVTLDPGRADIYTDTPDHLKDIEGLEGGHTGESFLYGDSGPNGLFSGGGRVNVSGGDGDDLLEASTWPRDDILGGDGGDDYILAGGGSDRIDDPTWALGSNEAHVADGSDTIFGEDGPDQIVGGEGDDHISGGKGNDNVAGGPGNDLGIGGDGDDNVILGEGDDLDVEGVGDDEDAGDEGTDVLTYEKASAAVTIDLAEATATGNGADVVYRGFEIVRGTPFEDTIAGNEEPNIIFGLAGDDNISGMDGDDELDGGDGSDTADGGMGLDQCVNFELALFCENLPTAPPVVATDIPSPPLPVVAWPTIDGNGPSAGPVEAFGGTRVSGLLHNIAALRRIARAPASPRSH